MKVFLNWAAKMFPILTPHMGNENEEHEVCPWGRLMLAYRLYRDRGYGFVGNLPRIDVGLEAFPHHHHVRRFVVLFVTVFGGKITYRQGGAIAKAIIRENDNGSPEVAWNRLYSQLLAWVPKSSDDEEGVAPSFAAYLAGEAAYPDENIVGPDYHHPRQIVPDWTMIDFAGAFTGTNDSNACCSSLAAADALPISS